MNENKPVQTLLSVIGLFFCVVFGIMLILNITIIIKGAIMPDTPPSLFGITPMVVQSASMSGKAEGHIEVGDLIFVKKVDTDTLAVGDVISYKEGNIIVTHRIISVNVNGDGQKEFITKGDANNIEDELPVSADNVIGKYQSRISKVGDFAMFLQTPVGMAAFIGVPLCAFIICDIVRRQKNNSKQNQKSAELQAEIDRLKALAGEKDDSDKK